MRRILISILIASSSFLTLCCTKQPNQKPSQADERFDVVKASFKENLAIKTLVKDKSGKTKQSEILVSNLDTGYPFVVIELALKGDELKFKTSEAKLADPNGKEYKLDGTAAFSIENYHPLPPKKGTIFDSYPVTETDSSGAKVNVNWIEGTEDIEVKAAGKDAKILLIFAAPRTDGGYKLSLSGSIPISVKPVEEFTK